MRLPLSSSKKEVGYNVHNGPKHSLTSIVAGLTVQNLVFENRPVHPCNFKSVTKKRAKLARISDYFLTILARKLLLTYFILPFVFA